MEVNLENKFAYPNEDDEHFAYTHLWPNGYEKKFLRNSPKKSKRNYLLIAKTKSDRNWRLILS